MALHPDYPKTRLFVEQSLQAGIRLALEERQTHYLAHVLRLHEGAIVAVFNGRDGEWQAIIETLSKKSLTLALATQLRTQKSAPDLWLLAAALKGKTETVLEKATELGITRFCPLKTQFTVVDRINETRLKNIATEAAEQCERLDVPVIDPLTTLKARLENWPEGRRLIFCDESGASMNAKELLPTLKDRSLGVLIGPEGGFSPPELDLLRSLPYVSGMCMGPRVMRADTAAFAALALLQAWCGDWDGKPSFRH